MTSVQLHADTGLIPLHVPGARADAVYRHIEMVPASGTQGLIFTIDNASHLRLWINSEAGGTRWVCVNPFLDGQERLVIDIAIEDNVSQGRQDGTLDLMVITQSDGPAAVRLRHWFVWNRLEASADPQTWRTLFAAAQPQDTHGLLPESAHWGQAPRAHRSRLLRGTDATGHTRLLWQRFDPQGAAIHNALEPWIDQRQTPSQVEVVCTVEPDNQGTRREGYARHVVFDDEATGKAGYMDLVWPPQDHHARSEVALTALNGSEKGWETGAGLWPLTLSGSGSTTQVYFDSTRGEQGVISCSSVGPRVLPLQNTLGGAPIPGRVRALHWPGDDDRVLRHDLIQLPASGEACLRQTESHDFSGADRGRSTLLSDDVKAFAVCLCSVPHSALQVLHVAVIHEQGGIELLSQDSHSGLWSRVALADDDVMGAVHEVNTFTTTLQVVDETQAPVANAILHVSADVPCHAYIGGRSMHLSPLGPTVVQADGLGQCRVAQVGTGLSAAQLRFDVVVDEQPVQGQAINPMQALVDRMRAVPDGPSLQQVKGFDGTRPFASVDLARCNSTSELLKPLIEAYDHTLLPERRAYTAQAIVSRTTVRSSASGLSVEHHTLDGTTRSRPLAELDDLGDMLSYLSNQREGTLAYQLEKLANGAFQLVLTIGQRVWYGLIELPQQALALIDQVIQNGLVATARDLVNWLGQIFNWNEILATKNTLRKLLTLLRQHTTDWMVHSAPPAIEQGLAWARKTLGELPALDPQTRAWLERNTTSGTGAVPYAANTQGPGANWALTSLQDHAASARFDAAGDWDFTADIQRLVESLGGDVETLLVDLGERLAGIDPAKQSLLTLIEDTLALSTATVIDAVGATSVKLCEPIAQLIDAAWTSMDQRLDIPVLTALYEQQLAPGSRASALDLMLLATAVAGDMGSRALNQRPLFSPALTDAIARAQTLKELLETPTPTDAETVWATDVQLAVTVLAGGAKLLYFVLWMDLRNTPGTTELNAGMVRLKCASDSVAWVTSMAWALVKCETQQPPQEALRIAAIFVFIDGIVSRSKDAIEWAYANDGERVPADASRLFVGVEGAVGTFVLAPLAIYNVVTSAVMPRTEPSNEVNWNFLVIMPVLQSLGTSAHFILSFVETYSPEVPNIRGARNVINGVRSLIPLVSGVGLSVAVKNDWRVPGTIAD